MVGSWVIVRLFETCMGAGRVHQVWWSSWKGKRFLGLVWFGFARPRTRRRAAQYLVWRLVPRWQSCCGRTSCLVKLTTLPQNKYSSGLSPLTEYCSKAPRRLRPTARSRMARWVLEMMDQWLILGHGPFVPQQAGILFSARRRPAHASQQPAWREAVTQQGCSGDDGGFLTRHCSVIVRWSKRDQHGRRELTGSDAGSPGWVGMQPVDAEI